MFFSVNVLYNNSANNYCSSEKIITSNVIALDGDFFYCATGYSVEIYDLEDLGDHFEISSVILNPTFVEDIDVCNGSLYIGTDNGLVLYNVQNPVNPIKESELILDKLITDIVCVNDYVYLLSKESDYTIIDVSNKSK